jgi:hypothetical protein
MKKWRERRTYWFSSPCSLLCWFFLGLLFKFWRYRWCSPETSNCLWTTRRYNPVTAVRTPVPSYYTILVKTSFRYPGLVFSEHSTWMACKILWRSYILWYRIKKPGRATAAHDQTKNLTRFNDDSDSLSFRITLIIQKREYFVPEFKVSYYLICSYFCLQHFHPPSSNKTTAIQNFTFHLFRTYYKIPLEGLSPRRGERA